MGQIAALQLDEGFISSDRLQALAIAGEGVAQAAPEVAAPEAGSLLQAADQTGTSPDAEEEKTKGKPDTETTSAQGRLLGMLRRAAC